MAKSGGTSTFFSGIASSAAWDWIKNYVGGPAMTATVVAVWGKLRHGSLDWLAIGGMFLFSLVLILLSHRRPRPLGSLPATIPVPVTDEAKSQLAIFTPLQIEAFQLAKDLRKFLRDMGERPKIDRPDDPAQYEKYVQDQLQVSRPWTDKLSATYETDFAPRVKNIYLEFKKLGLSQGGIRSVCNQVDDEKLAEKIPGWLTALAHQADQ